MTDKYGLAYLNLNELNEQTTAPASNDFTLRFDDSADTFVKVDASDLSATAGLNATVTEINQTCDYSTLSQAGGSAITLTAEDNNRTTLLDTAAGTTVTLPAATGTMNIFRFRVSVLATSNAHVIQTSAGTEHMQGIIYSMDDTSANAVAFAAVSGTSDTITLNRTTTGSVTLGEWIEIQDVASTLFHVKGFITNSGTPATPFSAAV